MRNAVPPVGAVLRRQSPPAGGPWPWSDIVHWGQRWVVLGCLVILTAIALPSPSLAAGLSSWNGAFNPETIAALPGFKALFSGTRPDNLGVKDGHLALCPSTPNCVVSQGGDDSHAIAPLTYSGDLAVAMTALAQVVADQPRSEIVEQTDAYLYAEFSSRLMGFVDDMEFYSDPANPGVIQVRVAARLGESDFGVNRDRVETIRAAFESSTHNLAG